MTSEAQRSEASASTELLAGIGENLRTQDNRITTNPIFAVQQIRRIYGLDPEYGENIVWLQRDGDYVEADAEEHTKLEAQYQETLEEPEGWTRTAYHDEWEFVTACFTEKGCKDYIARNGHNLNGPRIYVYGGYRNEEWRLIREHLMQMPANDQRERP